MRCAFRLLVVFFLLIGCIRLFSVFFRLHHRAEISTLNINSQYVLRAERIFPQSGSDVAFDQPWQLPEHEIYSDEHHLLEMGDYFLLTNFSYSKGLGNLMFQYAAMQGFVEENVAITLISSENLLLRAFNLNSLVVTPDLYEKLLAKSKPVYFNKCCSYEPIKLHYTYANFIQLIEGYMQSYKYFLPESAKLVASEFVFLPEIQQRAADLFEEAQMRWKLANAETKRRENADTDYELDINKEIYAPQTVCVHVRRGLDLTSHSRNLKHGHVAAPKEYYKRAMRYFRDKLKDVLFIISADDLAWAKQNLDAEAKGELFFLPRHTEREVAMNTLMQCDHMIISTGTFGWWSAYLLQDSRPSHHAEVVYFKDWPRPDSELDKFLNKTEYFMPDWLAM